MIDYTQFLRGDKKEVNFNFLKEGYFLSNYRVIWNGHFV